MVFYLKVNRNNNYVIPNLKHWLDACMLYDNSIIYILCDNDNLKKKIEQELVIDYNRVSFLESDRDCSEMNEVLHQICAVNKWVKVGQAHLKTHWHADEQGHDFFWNIDADDTFVCLDPIRIVEMFQSVEQYSKSMEITMNGLDMWRSMSVHEHWSKGDNWSLGITFVDNRVDWKTLLMEHRKEPRQLKKIYETDSDANLDWYFTYLRDIKAERIETFYFENMKFMHFYDYFINFPHLSSFSHWKDGKIKYPILEHCFGSKARKEIPIASDIIRFDMDITDDESMLALISCSGEVFSFWGDIRNNNLKVGHVMKKRCEHMLQEIGKKKIVCWGACESFYRNIEMIQKACHLEYTCDNDSAKWGKKLTEEVVCISPEELKKMKDDVFVLVLVDRAAVNHKIIHQLLEMGITCFDHYDNWIEAVEGVV